ncbi:hypothetical protein SLA2020_207290 [Shorea laevis]
MSGDDSGGLTGNVGPGRKVEGSEANGNLGWSKEAVSESDLGRHKDTLMDCTSSTNGLIPKHKKGKAIKEISGKLQEQAAFWRGMESYAEQIEEQRGRKERQNRQRRGRRAKSCAAMYESSTLIGLNKINLKGRGNAKIKKKV